MWRWIRQKPIPEGFPQGFKVQSIRVRAAIGVSELPSADIAKYFREHPDVAQALLMESYDKRFTPSTFIQERGDDFDVGWFTRDGGYQAVRTFSNLADAATDYLLFSLGKSRYTSQR